MTISLYSGKHMVNIREFYEKDGEYLPGKKVWFSMFYFMQSSFSVLCWYISPIVYIMYIKTPPSVPDFFNNYQPTILPVREAEASIHSSHKRSTNNFRASPSP